MPETIYWLIIFALFVLIAIMSSSIHNRDIKYHKLKQECIDNSVAGHNEKTGIFEVYERHELVKGSYEKGHKDGIEFEKERAKIFNDG